MLIKKSELRAEWIKIKKIQGIRKKAGYIREYYGLWLMILAGILSLGIYGAHQYHTAIKENWFYITFANTYADVGNHSDLWRDYISFTGYDTRKKQVTFNNAAYFDYGKSVTGNSYFETFVAYEEAGTLDALTMEKESLALVGESGRLMDLNSDACKTIREQYKDRLIYSTPYDQEYSKEQVPVGIDISDSILMSRYHIYKTSCALGIGAKSQHIEAVEEFLSFILEENR